MNTIAKNSGTGTSTSDLATKNLGTGTSTSDSATDAILSELAAKARKELGSTSTAAINKTSIVPPLNKKRKLAGDVHDVTAAYGLFDEFANEEEQYAIYQPNFNAKMEFYKMEKLKMDLEKVKLELFEKKTKFGIFFCFLN